MSRAGLLLLLALPLLPQPVAGQAAERHAQAAAQSSPAARPFGGTAARPRMPKTLEEPLSLSPNATRLRSEPAPVPNRDIEPPRDRAGDTLNPTLEPMLLPPERRQGVTFGREHLRETGPDRPFDNLVPGARLRIPFESGGQNR